MDYVRTNRKLIAEKLPLHAMKTNEEMEAEILSFPISALDQVKGGYIHFFHSTTNLEGLGLLKLRFS
jgi:hypothetical protein